MGDFAHLRTPDILDMDNNIVITYQFAYQNFHIFRLISIFSTQNKQIWLKLEMQSNLFTKNC